jgi:hypothetical protein
LEPGVIEQNDRDGIQSQAFVHRFGADSVELVQSAAAYTAKIQDAFTRYERISRGGFPAWLATDRGGKHYYFGTSPRSRLADPSDSTRIVAWHLDRIEDTDGNFITFDYRPSPEYPYLYKIAYGYKGVSPIYQIEFHLELRPDDLTSYAHGFEVTLDSRLRTIEIKAAGVLYAAYAFEYAPDPLTTGEPRATRSLLSSVKKYGSNAQLDTALGTVIGGDSLPPTEFRYALSQGSARLPTFAFAKDTSTSDRTLTIPSGRTNHWADINGDGLMDFCQAYTVTDTDLAGRPTGIPSGGVTCRVSSTNGFGREYSKFPLDAGYPETRMFADINGDGKADFCRLVGNNGSKFARCLLSTGEGFGQE